MPSFHQEGSSFPFEEFHQRGLTQNDLENDLDKQDDGSITENDDDRNNDIDEFSNGDIDDPGERIEDDKYLGEEEEENEGEVIDDEDEVD